MGRFYEKVLERFMRYVKIDTQSKAGSPETPSTAKQKTLGKMLRDELIACKVQYVFMSDTGCVYGFIPSTLPGGAGKAVGFLAHMDTAPDASGENVMPRVLENYDGGDIILNSEKGIVMKAQDFPALGKYVGDDLVFSDGTTLLGGDDKAGVAALMTMAEYFAAHPELPHGPICIAFNPDEEVGRGTEGFDLRRFGAELAYTIDGDGSGGYFYETFNAVEAQITISGLSVHPGTAKGIMKNALEIGCELISMLPALERPQNTEGREGYFHPFVFDGAVSRSFIRCLIRDHELSRFEERRRYVEKCVAELNRLYGEGTAELAYVGEYFNMREVISKHPYMIDYLRQAISDCGLKEPLIKSGCANWRADFLPDKAKSRRNTDVFQGFLTQLGRKISRQGVRFDLIRGSLSRGASPCAAERTARISLSWGFPVPTSRPGTKTRTEIMNLSQYRLWRRMLKF